MLEAFNRRSPKPGTDHGTESREGKQRSKAGEEEETRPPTNSRKRKANQQEKQQAPTETAGERKKRRRPKRITKLYIILYKGIWVNPTSNS